MICNVFQAISFSASFVKNSIALQRFSYVYKSFRNSFLEDCIGKVSLELYSLFRGKKVALNHISEWWKLYT